MLIGAMNHPASNLIAEIQWMSEMELDFIDITLEPPAAAVSKINLRDVRKALDDSGLKVVGHTAYYLPIASPFESLRLAAREELSRCLEAFARLGAHWMNIHPDGHSPFQDAANIGRNLQTLKELMPAASACGVGIMIENLPGKFNASTQLSGLLDPLPELGLHIDIGHCNLLTEKNTTDDLLSRYGSRVRHVHLHDNKGGSADLHLPLGTGTLDVRHCIQALHATGYDDTITLEVFSPDRRYFRQSCEILRDLWSECTRLRPNPPAVWSTVDRVNYPA